MKIPRDEKIKVKNERVRILIETNMGGSEHSIIVDNIFDNVTKNEIHKILTILEDIE
jgi:hypothetical protein